jgi:hypothetical protein
VTLEKDVSIHIFTASAALVGVCLTVIGLIRVVVVTINIDTIGDNLLAVDALLFLASCLLSYWALRTRSIRRMYHVERVADAIFVTGMLLMTGVCSIIAYELLWARPLRHRTVECPNGRRTQHSSPQRLTRTCSCAQRAGATHSARHVFPHLRDSVRSQRRRTVATTIASMSAAAAQDRIGLGVTSDTHDGDWPMLMKLPVQVLLIQRASEDKTPTSPPRSAEGAH